MAEATIPSVADRVNLAPLVSWRGAALALAFGVVLTWPMLVTGAVFLFPDSQAYLRGGVAIWQVLSDLLPDLGGGAPTGQGDGSGPPVQALVVDEEGGATTSRSLVYPPFASALVVPFGPYALAVAQGALTVFTAFGLIGPAALARPGRLAAGGAALAVLTPLPLYAVYVMPDVFAAVPILYAAILMRRIDDLSTAQVLVLSAVAAFATGCHYGFLPLAGLAVVAVLLWRLVTRRLSGASLGIGLVVIGLAPIANVAASALILDAPSVTPLRLPVILARSIEDGPARWYIEESCPEADLTVCEAFADGIPENVGEFHYEIAQMPRTLAEGVRDEELQVIWQAFLRYPWAQTRSLFGNTAEQLVRVGVGGLQPAAGIGPDLRREGEAPPAARALLGVYDQILPWTALLSTLGLAGLVLTGRLDRIQAEILVVVILGLLVNAAVFGGLSAPVERYQTRVIWLLTFLLALFWAEGIGRRRKAVP